MTGRPPGSDYYASRADLLAQVARYAQDLALHGELPTLKRVARRFGYSARGLESALRREQLSWSAIRHAAVARHFGRVSAGVPRLTPPDRCAILSV